MYNGKQVVNSDKHQKTPDEATVHHLCSTNGLTGKVSDQVVKTVKSFGQCRLKENGKWKRDIYRAKRKHRERSEPQFIPSPRCPQSVMGSSAQSHFFFFFLYHWGFNLPSLSCPVTHECRHTFTPTPACWELMDGLCLTVRTLVLYSDLFFLRDTSENGFLRSKSRRANVWHLIFSFAVSRSGFIQWMPGMAFKRQCLDVFVLAHGHVSLSWVLVIHFQTALVLR